MCEVIDATNMSDQEINEIMCENPNYRFCPICHNIYDRACQIDIYDCHGIYFKGVCSEKCEEEARQGLQEYPYEEVDNGYENDGW